MATTRRELLRAELVAVATAIPGVIFVPVGTKVTTHPSIQCDLGGTVYDGETDEAGFVYSGGSDFYISGQVSVGSGAGAAAVLDAATDDWVHKVISAIHARAYTATAVQGSYVCSVVGMEVEKEVIVIDDKNFKAEIFLVGVINFIEKWE